MGKLSSRIAGRHFLQTPGPNSVPDRILRAMDRALIDQRGPEFQRLAKSLFERLKNIFKTKSRVLMFPGSGTGACEAALVNPLSPGDKVLMFETGHFAALWKDKAAKLALLPDIIAGDWRSPVDPNAIEEQLRHDTSHEIKAVCVVHNETSTGIASRISAVRRAIDEARHPALLIVDAVSSLASIDYRHDEWGVDVTASSSQYGLMLPPGLAFNAVSEKALAAATSSRMPKFYWSWAEMAEANANGFFRYSPATSLLYGLDAALDMLNEEGLPQVYARHERQAEAVRRAVRAWGLEILGRDRACYSSVLTAVLMPDGHSADAFRKLVVEELNMSLGAGLSKLATKLFRIAHFGDINMLTILGALAGIELGLDMAGIPFQRGGVEAASTYLAESRCKSRRHLGKNVADVAPAPLSLACDPRPAGN